MTRSLFEDLHEPLSISQGLASFEDNRRTTFKFLVLNMKIFDVFY